MDNRNKEEIIREFLEFINQRGLEVNKKLKKTNLFYGILRVLEENKFVVGKKIEGFPVSIFTEKLSTLESIICFLREIKYLKYKEIASVLKKNSGHIGIIYRKAKKKDGSKLDISSSVVIPFNIFKKNVSVFEQVIIGLKKLGYSFKQISEILHRNYKTIWTVYQRGKKKL